MKNTLLVIVLLVVLVGVYLGRHTLKTMLMGSSPSPTPTAAMQPATGAPEAASGASGVMTTSGTTKEFAVSGTEFAFSPSTLTVAKGDTVKVTFTNNGAYPHNFTITEFNVASKTVSPGQSDTVTFTADKAGSFKYFCSVPGHEDKGMVGTLTVQ